MVKKLKVLSLFDGISCGQVALERAGIPVETYYASEIDKYAIQIAQKNYPNTIQLGDVTELDCEQFEGIIDLLIGGSPCQDLSIANSKRQGLEGSKSGLFWEYVRILKSIQPKYFLFENNYGMPKESQKIITEALGVEPVLIDSALVSAQQRKRLYWTNIPNVTQPMRRKLYLKDVVEQETNETTEDKILMSKIQTTVKVRKHEVDNSKLVELLRHHKHLTNKQIADSLNVPVTKVEHWFRNDKSFAIPDAEKWLELKQLLNIETNEFDKAITEFEIRGGTYDMSNRVYHIAGKSPTLTTLTGGKQRKIIIDDDGNLSFLTPIHCERLQTLPDNYTEGISDRQRYKCLGNGWTVDVIAHIFGGLKNEI